MGFEYAGSVRQDNGQASFKKVQNPASVLKGQIIIYFKKIDNPKSRAKADMGLDIVEQMFQDIEAIIIENKGATLEEIWNELVIKSMNNGYLHLISGKFETFIPAINERFEKDTEGKYHLQKDYALTNYGIPLEKRVEYITEAILKKAEAENGKSVGFDDIVLQVMPLSKNGIQANKKMVKDVLEEIALCDFKAGMEAKGQKRHTRELV